MRMRSWLLLWLCIVVPGYICAGTIQYTVTPLGGNEYTYNYILGGFSLAQGNEVDIRFDPLLYSTLSNGVAGPDFTLLLLQPNNPPGAFGDYSASANVDNPSLAGPFSVDFEWLGSGLPGSQPYFINRYDQTGQHVIEQGQTTLAGGNNTVPEPGTFTLAAMALLIAGMSRVRRGKVLK